MNRAHRTTVATLVLLLIGTSALAQNTGRADFSKYVALGDSLTAGFWSGGLSSRQQVAGYPALIHQQTRPGQSFEQPLICELEITDPSDICPGLPSQLQLLSLSPLIIAPLPGTLDFPDCLTLPPDTGDFPNACLTRPYDNLGIPGADVSDGLNTVCSEPLVDSPFFCTILRNAECAPVFVDPVNGTCLTGVGGASAVGQGLSLSPTFITAWYGPNDVLGAATSGMVIEGVTITPLASFTSDYQQLVATLSASGAALALANVPDVLSIPYVTTIPPIVVDPITGEPVIIDGQLVPLTGVTTTGTRALTLDDRVLLPASAALAQGDGIPPSLGGSGNPLADVFVLDVDEIGIISQRILDFNDVIATEAQGAGAALVDTYTLLQDAAANGILIGGIEFTSDFLSGGLFSYDGVHPTSLGYGAVANEFIRSINRTFGAAIVPVDLSPFVFGEIGSPVFLPPQTVQGFQMTVEARDQLLGSLGSPDADTLERIKRSAETENRSPRQKMRVDRGTRERTGRRR